MSVLFYCQTLLASFVEPDPPFLAGAGAVKKGTAPAQAPARDLSVTLKKINTQF